MATEAEQKKQYEENQLLLKIVAENYGIPLDGFDLVGPFLLLQIDKSDGNVTVDGESTYYSRLDGMSMNYGTIVKVGANESTRLPVHAAYEPGMRVIFNPSNAEVLSGFFKTQDNIVRIATNQVLGILN